MSTHPYQGLPLKAFWRRSVAEQHPDAVDPVGEFPVRIGRDTRVATAGSCFAQHIARHLRAAGYNYFIAEPGHPAIVESVARKNGYGLFSARYGNIYTARQMIQTFDRAFGDFAPQEPAWTDGSGCIVDPFRPTVQPGGFIAVEEMLADRAHHLAAVRRMFEQLDVFVFTLGLTECWRSRADGAVFPLCPGVEGGSFSAERYEFYNQPVEDVIADLTRLASRLNEVNPKASIILTVSPVPLVATATPGAHVLAATTYSKSVLRVSAEVVSNRFPYVHYFPSYEIVTGSYNRGRYFAPDLRNVLEAGVSHVMRVFLAHTTEGGEALASLPAAPMPESDFARASAALIDVECDEIALDE